MAPYLSTVVSLNEIQKDFPFCSRRRLEDAALEASLRRRGVIYPVTLDSKRRVLSGHKRVHLASQIGIDRLPACVIEKKLPEQEFFLFSVLSNWNQTLSEADRAWTLGRAREEFKFSEGELIEEVLPALGLSPARPLLEEYLEVAGLDPALLDLIAEGKLPFRGAKALARLTPSNQKTFARELASHIHLTTNQLLNAVSWLEDLMKTSGLDLAGYLSTCPLWDSPEGDRRQKGETFHKILRARRFPKLAEREEAFARFSREIRAEGEDLVLEAPAHFEGEGYSLRLNLKRPESLDRMLERLKQKRSALHALFEILL